MGLLLCGLVREEKCGGVGCGARMRKPQLFLEVLLTFPLFLGILTFRCRLEIWYVTLVKSRLKANLEIWNKAVESVSKYMFVWWGV